MLVWKTATTVSTFLGDTANKVLTQKSDLLVFFSINCIICLTEFEIYFCADCKLCKYKYVLFIINISKIVSGVIKYYNWRALFWVSPWMFSISLIRSVTFCPTITKAFSSSTNLSSCLWNSFQVTINSSPFLRASSSWAVKAKEIIN